MTLQRNEKTKLLANALDRASTASVTVGALAPVAAAFYGAGGNGASISTLVIGSLVWLLAAIALHLAARRALNGLSL